MDRTLGEGYTAPETGGLPRLSGGAWYYDFEPAG